VDREDLFTSNSKTAVEKVPVRLVKRGETPPSNGSTGNTKQTAEPTVAIGSNEDSFLGATEPEEELADGGAQAVDYSQSNQRIHYSESSSDVDLPRHILQLTFADPNKFDESKIRNFAASRLNAELRVDRESTLLIFQSSSAATKALQSSPFQDQFGASLEAWTPRFFPTSMF
jgi:hypothetical protein